MPLLAHIVGVIHLLDIHFEEDGTYKYTAWRCAAGGTCKPEEYDIKKLANRLIGITVSGCGVVTKPINSGIAAKIAADTESFIRSENGDEVSFTRRDRINPLLDELAQADIYPISIGCAETPIAAANTAFSRLRWQMLLQITPAGSSMAQAAARRLMPILLGLFLVLLSINAVVGPNLQLRRQQLQTQSEALQQRNTKVNSASAERQQIIRNFTQRLPIDYAVLCDCLGSRVPDQITLTELDAEPLTKRFEQDKPLVRATRSAIIRGISPSTATIGSFTETLADIPEIRSVRLVSVEKTRNGKMQFQIEIRL